MSSTPIAVVGAGIAGASAAYHLAGRTDGPIVVCERGDLAGEAAARSAAFVGFYGSGLEPRLKWYGMGLYNEFLADPRAAPESHTPDGHPIARFDGDDERRVSL